MLLRPLLLGFSQKGSGFYTQGLSLSLRHEPTWSQAGGSGRCLVSESTAPAPAPQHEVGDRSNAWSPRRLQLTLFSAQSWD